MTKDRYLFRGFHKEENGKETIYIDGQAIKGRWVYGDLRHSIYKDNGARFISTYQNYMQKDSDDILFEVIPETIGLGTVLKNGLKIFEGDIYHHGDIDITYTVVWHDSGLIGKQNKSSSYAGLEGWSDRIQILGTKFDKEVNDNE